MRYAAIFLCGVLFALGLGIAGMTQPEKIIAFLDVTGNWDPSLLFVMGGAVGVNMVLYRLTLKRPRPVLEEHFVIPSRRRINARLVSGAALFGIGWGLSGYCPGPVVVSSVTGWTSVFVFIAAMLLGMFLFQKLQGEEPRPAGGSEPAGKGGG
ncbi:MAG TPA: YeeE/YedE family protein [Chromatiales bacterium]|nr:YeeE/YedE family protein [Chromatiales bacterium]